MKFEEHKNTDPTKAAGSARRWSPSPLLELKEVARLATLQGHLHCLEYLSQMFGLENLPRGLVGAGAGAGHEACCSFLLERGYQVSETDLIAMIQYGPSAEALQHWLPAVQVSDVQLKALMHEAVRMKSPSCMHVLYAFNPQRTAQAVAPSATEHPAFDAVRAGSLACLTVAVTRNGAPALQHLDLAAAAAGGEDMLSYVHAELGVALDVRATHGAARGGHVGALRYALEHGAPWQDIRTFEAAVVADSLACLRLLHEYAFQVGYPAGFFDAPNIHVTPPPARSLGVLRYVRETMRGSAGSDWADRVLGSTADGLEIAARLPNFTAWGMVLYLAGEMDLLEHHPRLHAMAGKRRERAAGLARAFDDAGRVGKEKASPWHAMGKVPEEVVELIAFWAHLGLQPGEED